MSDEIVLDRELYRKIKSMNREEMNHTLNNIFDEGKEAAYKEITVTEVNYDKIRSEISDIKGIGDVRLEQIMDIIRKNI